MCFEAKLQREKLVHVYTENDDATNLPGFIRNQIRKHVYVQKENGIISVPLQAERKYRSEEAFVCLNKIQ
jgi:hypothetical protein